MNKLVEAILMYQRKKRELVQRITGLDLIPDEVAIEREDLTREVVDEIVQSFNPSLGLSSDNCLHCNIHGSRCDECEYVKHYGADCKGGSHFMEIRDKWRSARTKVMVFDGVENEAEEHLYRLGLELDKAVKDAVLRMTKEIMGRKLQAQADRTIISMLQRME